MIATFARRAVVAQRSFGVGALTGNARVKRNGFTPVVRTQVASFKTKNSKLRNNVAANPAVFEKSGMGFSFPSGKFSISAGIGSIVLMMQQHPFAAQTTIATFKTSLADILVQKKVENRENIDWRRNALFLLFGFSYLGVMQWLIYVRGFQRLFPAMEKFCNQSIKEKLQNKAGIRALFGQIGLDFLVVQPLIYFPVFYGFKTLVEEDLGGKSRFQLTFENWRKNFWEDNIGMSAFWFPMDVVIYSVPLWLRLPLTHGVAFVWCCILSVFRGGATEAETA